MKEKLRYRLAQMDEGELDEVSWIEQVSFPNPWPPRVFWQELRNPHAVNLVARSEGHVLGYLVAEIHGASFHIGNIAVAPGYRRQGIGRELLRKALRIAGDRRCLHALLDVRPSNLGAIRLYAELGFKVVGKRPLYYSEPEEDALVMQRDLSF